VEVDPVTDDVSLKYEAEDGSGIIHEDFDMVVLSIGLTPSESSKNLAQIAGVELDENGFVKTKIESPLETSKPGIFVCGAMQAPKDIPDTVADASGAASKASSLLSSERGTLVTEKEYPPEKDIGTEIRTGGRNDDRPYCSRACCTVAVKNAIRLKESDPDRNVTILYRDIRTFGVWEELYTKARELDVIFMRYTEDKEPEVSEKTVRVFDHLMNMDFEINYDLMVLSAPMVTPETNELLAPMFKVALDANRFFLEAHIKLRPVECATDGVFLAGTSQAPKLVDESVSQASAAASRACTILSRDFLETIGNVSVVDPDLCIGCGRCTLVCPYKAPELKEITVETEEIVYTTKKCEINPAICKGCGCCAAECPTGAITARHFTTPQIMAVIKAYGEGI
jgi:heterodisulfide reductase subunit A-like polyferredoxin